MSQSSQAQPDAEFFGDRAARLAATLGAAGQRVIRQIGQNPAAALASSAADLAASAGTSDATVIRTIQALGYAGIGELKQALAASLNRATPADDMRRTLAELGAADLDTADLDRNAAQALDMVLGIHREALTVLGSRAFREQLAAAMPLLHAAARIAVFGIGPSAALARYAAILLSRSGRRSKCLDVTGIMLADQLLDLRHGDAVLALSYGRAYSEVSGLFGEARRLGLPIVLVSDSRNTAQAKAADAVLVIPRGKTQRVALHGGTIAGLEALILALAAGNGKAALTTLDRLNDLRAAIGGKRQDLG